MFDVVLTLNLEEAGVCENENQEWPIEGCDNCICRNGIVLCDAGCNQELS